MVTLTQEQAEQALKLLTAYANSGVSDSVSLECAQVCGVLRNALALPQHSSSGGEVMDNAMVDGLANAMKQKLARARTKGRDGWEDPAEISIVALWHMMVAHAHKTNLDMVDVANFAGMLWWRMLTKPEERDELLCQLTAPPPQPTPEQEALDAARELLTSQFSEQDILLMATMCNFHLSSAENDIRTKAKRLGQAQDQLRATLARLSVPAQAEAQP